MERACLFAIEPFQRLSYFKLPGLLRMKIRLETHRRLCARRVSKRIKFPKAFMLEGDLTPVDWRFKREMQD
jgi:hypothetical protein